MTHQGAPVTKQPAARPVKGKPSGRARGADGPSDAAREAARARKAATAVTTVLLGSDPGEIDLLISATSGDAAERLDEATWGPAPEQDQVAAALVANLRKRFQARRAAEQASVSRAEVAELLGTSEQTVTDYLAAHRITGLKRGRRWLIPAWQLEPDAERGILPCLDRLSAAFPGGVVSLSAWATRPSAQLDDRTPRDALAIGDVDAVLRAASQLTAAGW